MVVVEDDLIDLHPPEILVFIPVCTYTLSFIIGINRAKMGGASSKAARRLPTTTPTAVRSVKPHLPPREPLASPDPLNGVESASLPPSSGPELAAPQESPRELGPRLHSKLPFSGEKDDGELEPPKSARKLIVRSHTTRRPRSSLCIEPLSTWPRLRTPPISNHSTGARSTDSGGSKITGREHRRVRSRIAGRCDSLSPAQKTAERTRSRGSSYLWRTWSRPRPNTKTQEMDRCSRRATSAEKYAVKVVNALDITRSTPVSDALPSSGLLWRFQDYFGGCCDICSNRSLVCPDQQNSVLDFQATHHILGPVLEAPLPLPLGGIMPFART